MTITYYNHGHFPCVGSIQLSINFKPLLVFRASGLRNIFLLCFNPQIEFIMPQIEFEVISL